MLRRRRDLVQRGDPIRIQQIAFRCGRLQIRDEKRPRRVVQQHHQATLRIAGCGQERIRQRKTRARATLDGIAQQVTDVVEAMSADAGQPLAGLRVDGGAAANDLLMATQADLLGAEVTRPTVLETTALGAAFLAGLGVGLWESLDDISARWVEDRRFAPTSDAAGRAARRAAWAKAVSRLR